MKTEKFETNKLWDSFEKRVDQAVNGIEKEAKGLVKKISNQMNSIVNQKTISKTHTIDPSKRTKPAVPQKSLVEWLNVIIKECNKFCKKTKITTEKTKEQQPNEMITENRKEMHQLMQWVRKDKNLITPGLYRVGCDPNDYDKFKTQGLVQSKDELLQNKDASNLIGRRTKELFFQTNPFPPQFFDCKNVKEFQEAVKAMPAKDREFLFDVVEFLAYVDRTNKDLIKEKKGAVELKALTGFFTAKLVPASNDPSALGKQMKEWGDKFAFVIRHRYEIFQKPPLADLAKQKKLPPLPEKPHL